MSPTDDKICITTFVKMCELCKIKFVITNGDNDKQIFGQETYELKASKWTELKFVKHAFGAKRVKLAIITMGETSSDPHWAMQEIQQCGQNGNPIVLDNTYSDDNYRFKNDLLKRKVKLSTFNPQ